VALAVLAVVAVAVAVAVRVRTAAELARVASTVPPAARSAR